MKKHLMLFGALLITVSAMFSQDVNLEKLKEIAIVEQKIMVPMRDGIRLCTDVYRPKTNDPVPIIFYKTPYNFNGYGDGEENTRTYRRAYDAVKRGYAFIVQNERGKYFSEGTWDILGPPTTDGYDAFTWMAEQPWSNGKIGTLGCSSTAEWQMAVGALDHPNHTVMVPMGFGAGVGRVGEFYEQGNWYRGGAQQMLFTTWLYRHMNIERPVFPKDMTQEQLVRASRFYDLVPEMPSVDWSEKLWHLPAIDIIKNVDGPKSIYEDMMSRAPNDPDWYKGGLYHDNMPIAKPTFWFVSWYDVSTSPNLALFNHARAAGITEEVRDNQYLVIAPTLHCAFTRATENTIVGERSVGDARLDYDRLIYGWFDTWLKEEEAGLLDTLSRVIYYTMGSNEWQTAASWPPQDVQTTTYYLNSAGQANTMYGDGKLTLSPPEEDKPDAFVYDPMNPVLSLGGNVCCTGNAVKGGAYDQRPNETRQDILVYTTDPLEEGLEVTGTIDIQLFVSTDVKDTDFTVKLIDVYPDGRAYNLDETILRARYREGFEQEVFMEEGEVYELNLSPLSTSNYFKPGHRIRIEVSSSNFPRFDRNLNTGGNNYDESEGVIAHNKVHHSTAFPSHIRLPIRPREATGSK